MSDALQRLKDALEHVDRKEDEDGPLNYPYLYGYLHASVEGFLITHRER